MDKKSVENMGKILFTLQSMYLTLRQCLQNSKFYLRSKVCTLHCVNVYRIQKFHLRSKVCTLHCVNVYRIQNFIYAPKYVPYTASIFTEFKISQRHCFEIFYIGFHRNWFRYMESEGRNSFALSSNV